MQGCERVPEKESRLTMQAKIVKWGSTGLDALRPLRQQVRQELLAEAKKHDAWKLLRGIPSIGPIRAALIIAILQTPHRFRAKRPLWTYIGFGIETHSSAEHR